MVRTNIELWLAVFSILLMTAIYGMVVLLTGSIPAASNFFGHTLGIIGFTLMVMTETLYTLRKRTRSGRWGKMSYWLKFHIYTGIVGPFLVLLHSSWKFNGLAGVVMLFTIIIVISGFIGRYIYTAIPRTADGVEFDYANLQEKILLVESQLVSWIASQPPDIRRVGMRLVSIPDQQSTGIFTVINRFFTDFSFRIRLNSEARHISHSQKATVSQLKGLIKQRRQLKHQLSSIATARKLLSTWHTVHVPIGIVLFTTAVVHVIAAFYYATLLH